MNNFPFIGPGGFKEQHRRAAQPSTVELTALYRKCKEIAMQYPVVIITRTTANGSAMTASALTRNRKRHENLIVGALDSWGASPEAVYRAVMTYDNR